VRGRLPLFVLPTVLLPGGLLPLHVFEPRYRRMVATCLEGERRFGVLFHDPDEGHAFAVVEGQIGCVAEILEFRPLIDGRSLVLTRGRERFRVRDGIENDQDYAEALVEEFPHAESQHGAEGPPGDILDRRRTVLRLFRNLLRQTLAAEQLADVELPGVEAGDISFRVAAYIRTAPRWHQALLELPSEWERLGLLVELLGGEGGGGG
jgi:ATP-dependent Lon protease